MKKIDNIDDGIGAPEWRLSLCLLFCWIVIALVLIKGVTTSGKVAYFTALFPYLVLISLLIRGVTLDGAVDGILFFLTPDFTKLQNPQVLWLFLFKDNICWKLNRLFIQSYLIIDWSQVWYAAIVQCFYSLGVAAGPIIINASYNHFRHNIYRYIRSSS